MVKNLLQGKPLRHPLHPLLVHFPIALFLLSLVLDIASWLTDGGQVFVRGAWYTMAGGVLTALVAALPGFVDRSSIRSDHPARILVNIHMVLNLSAVMIYIINLFWRAQTAWTELSTPVGPLALALIAVGVLMVSGFLGGHMVYKYGVAVGRHRRAADLPERTLHPRSAASSDGWVTIPEAGALAEGHSLRLEIDEVVMSLVRSKERFYAVQEFCTHRCGPLSEGTYHNGEITCPWHGSRFDPETGKVTHGPAKVDLRAFEVRVHEGEVQVRSPNRSG